MAVTSHVRAAFAVDAMSVFRVILVLNALLVFLPIVTARPNLHSPASTPPSTPSTPPSSLPLLSESDEPPISRSREIPLPPLFQPPVDLSPESTVSPSLFEAVSVSTPLGNVTGFVSQGPLGESRQFWNIPFAFPPIGLLRWSPPRPLSEFPSNPLDATNTTRRSCADMEDCLYLLVTLPSAATPVPAGGFPVFVSIYGGGFVGGEFMDLSQWVEHTQAFVYVGLSYRLNILGFFPLPDLTQENMAKMGFNSSGNQGIQDQTLALRWVKDNIAYFSGDPTKVTVQGQSAGSISVCMQMLSPAARGLFRAAIMESGGCSAPVSMGGTLQQREQDVGEVIAALTPCGKVVPPRTRLACLRSLTWAELQSARQLFGPQPGLYGQPFSPIWDGVTIPASPAALFESGQFSQVPLLIGTNTGEAGAYWFSAGPHANYSYTWTTVVENINLYSTNNNETLIAFYKAQPLSLYRIFIMATTAQVFLCPSRALARAIASRSHPVWLYQDNYVDAGQGYAWLNVTVHAEELQHVYNNGWSTKDDSTALSAQMQNIWLRFIVEASPNVPIPADSIYQPFFPDEPLPMWPIYTNRDSASLYISNSPAGVQPPRHLSIVHNMDMEQCDLWDAAIPPNWY